VEGTGFDDNDDIKKDDTIAIQGLNVIVNAITPDAFKKFDKNDDGTLFREELEAVE
jgi:hypothetical protein